MTSTKNPDENPGSMDDSRIWHLTNDLIAWRGVASVIGCPRSREDPSSNARTATSTAFVASLKKYFQDLLNPSNPSFLLSRYLRIRCVDSPSVENLQPTDSRIILIQKCYHRVPNRSPIAISPPHICILRTAFDLISQAPRDTKADLAHHYSALSFSFKFQKSYNGLPSSFKHAVIRCDHSEESAPRSIKISVIP